ncbi:hypothetical protein Ga0074812_1687 [Parafrankia irregularis]|uniref:Uncharacterized protein n=1 Tax=Parafrankia irregularis TaxID=795642 RepID=A0A0S4R2X7_9ACTN|nr:MULTISPECIES: hypothetical protein [Parafrankia]MBE3206606.1 hypothetical protein [Parafrankia sp. CH37]MBE3206728.1 hypothetical protein [Parafrankia sp. CH37]CUU61254.1 hypothetical protein Ga0074812_1687 [Parafrankia irregularis]
MTDARASLGELAALSAGGGGVRESYEPTHYFPHRLWLPGISTTDGQARWGALGLGRTPAGAAKQLHDQLINLPKTQWIEAAQFDRGRNGPGRSDWPSRRIAWDGEHWGYAAEDGNCHDHWRCITTQGLRPTPHDSIGARGSSGS